MRVEDWFFLIQLPILMDWDDFIWQPTKLGKISDWFMSKMFSSNGALFFVIGNQKDSF